MAKGNDGNYLRHSIEVESAARLARMDDNDKGRLHIAFTHGMAPFEPCEEPGRRPAAYKLFERVLNASKERGQASEPQVITAY